MSDDGPKKYYKPTVPDVILPPPWAAKLGEKIEAIGRDVTVIKDELSTHSERLDTIDAWRKSASVRVRGESETNIKQDAVQAEVLVRLENVEKKTDEQTTKLVTIEQNSVDIKKTISDALQSPMVKKLISTAIGAIIALLAYLTGYLQTKGH